MYAVENNPGIPESQRMIFNQTMRILLDRRIDNFCGLFVNG
jgi:hypothetical protein